MPAVRVEAQGRKGAEQPGGVQGVRGAAAVGRASRPAPTPLTRLCATRARDRRAQLTDVSTTLRILLVSCATAASCFGLLGLVVFHAVAPQKAPTVLEAEPVELYREAKVVIDAKPS